MTVRAKLNTSVLVIIAVFLLMILGLVLALRIVLQMQELRVSAEQAVGSLYQVTDTAKDLILTNEQLQSEAGNLEEAVNRFQSSLIRLEEQQRGLPVVDSVQEEIDRTLSTWDLALESLTEAQEQMTELIADESISAFRKTGLANIASFAEEQNDPDLLQEATAIIDNLLAFDVSGKGLMVNNLESITATVDRQAMRVTNTSFRVVGVGAAILITLAVFLVFRFTRNLSVRIRRLRTVMERLAERDLTTRHHDKGRDEIADLTNFTNSTLENLSDFLASVQHASASAQELKESLASGTAESASSLNQISKTIESIRGQFGNLEDTVSRSTRAIGDIDERFSNLTRDLQAQAGAINESASSVEEMNASIHSVQRLSAERKNAADQLVQVIQEGGERIQTTNESIRAVSNELDDILEIIEIINGIADQTNLLSMNAAIESAHAGEAGKGFAVVAEEIRKLAESSSENATRIDQQLRSIATRIQESLRTSQEASGTFGRIDQDIGLFSSSLDEIVSNMNELAEGSSTILERTQEVSRITGEIRNFANSVKESSTTVRSAMGEAENLSTEMGGGLSEIDHGAKEILKAITDITDISDQNRQRMDTLQSLVAEFRTESREDRKPNQGR